MKVKCLLSISELVSGQDYVVYGIRIFKKSIEYLVSNGYNWYSAEHFDVIDSLLPPIFYFNYIKYKNNEISTVAIWSYKEMVFDQFHSDYLLERRTAAVDIFYKRKAEIDEFEEMRGMKK